MPDDETAELTEERPDECLDLVLARRVARGISFFGPIDSLGTDFQDYCGGLQKVPAIDEHDFVTLTEAELRERWWGCSSDTFVRILENYDLRMEHKKLKNRMGTFQELSRRYVGHRVSHSFGYNFFDPAEDALFRISDIVRFERAHPEVLAALKASRSISEGGAYDTLVSEIEDYSRDHPVGDSADAWTVELAKYLREKHPDIIEARFIEACQEWNKTGKSPKLRSRAGLYTLLQDKIPKWAGKQGRPLGSKGKKESPEPPTLESKTKK